MTEEKKKFILYEYLLYFWDRKWFFLIVPLITTVLIAGAVYALKHDNKYTGESLFSTGSINKADLTDPNNIKAKYNDIKGLDVIVTEKNQVKFTVNGNSRDEVQKNLDHINTTFSKELKDQSNTQLRVSKVTLNDLENGIKDLNSSLSMYQEKLDRNLIIKTKNKLFDAKTRVNKMKSDQVFFEEPKVLSDSIHPKKTYLPESIAIGIILGILLTIALLMLLKYLGVAKKQYKRD